MNLVHLGSSYGGWTIDIDSVPEEGVVIDAGVGTDCSFAEALHELRPKLKFVMVDHTDEAKNFIEVVRGYPWMEFIHKAIAPNQVKTTMMHRHKTRSGSESVSPGHAFADNSSMYQVPCISLANLISIHHPVLVKLDIESAEYNTIHECYGDVPQVCCEFHHRMDVTKTKSDTEYVVNRFKEYGYEVIKWTDADEITFLRNK